MDLQVVLPVVIIFIAVAAATASLAWLLTDPQVVRRRLSNIAAGPAPGAASASVLEDGGSPFARRVRSFVPKSPSEMNRIERMLATAGYSGTWPAILFVLAQVGLAAISAILLFSYFGPGLGLVMALLAAGIAYFVPTLWLGRAIEKRKRAIQNGLPDAIDLMIVCIESGSGVDQALNRVAEELALPYPELARELDLVSAETRAGKPRLEAFKNFAERTKVDDVRSLVAMLVQTDRFGTSVGQALRTHAETSRTKRRQRAEEKAAKLGVKLLFPLVFCLFPAFYAVVLGPSMVRIFRQFVWGGQ
ncbi:MAG: type II secretion system F family protein [Acidobacteria bacterium]|nr:type II secretion system F family protein [Acidobacteriota bacterium]